ncbi:MAG: hypothetical protein K9G11_02230, partial [Rickettsiaceae bacterium]|nr:hypothetical protein [Rickettsiaceae bacterium]
EQDARKFKSDHLRFKDKFLHALSVVTKTLGLTSITNSLEARVNESSQKTLSNLERQVFEIKRGINNSTSQQPHSDASVVQKDKKHVKQPKKGGGISLQ